MFVDYYAVLEIPNTATKAQIKAAYKKQAIKWHPDKNPDSDTTYAMQEVNEAYLILNDDEARVRFDREYVRYYSYRKEKEKRESENSNKQQHEPKNHGQADRGNHNEGYETHRDAAFQFDDELLRKWVENARKQALRNVSQMLVEFRDSSAIGFGTFLSAALITILKVLGVAIFFAVIGFVVSSIKR